MIINRLKDTTNSITTDWRFRAIERKCNIGLCVCAMSLKTNFVAENQEKNVFGFSKQ